ncbi:hypothetical protein [Alsobacter sp. SYSU BS001988]
MARKCLTMTVTITVPEEMTAAKARREWDDRWSETGIHARVVHPAGAAPEITESRAALRTCLEKLAGYACFHDLVQARRSAWFSAAFRGPITLLDRLEY